MKDGNIHLFRPPGDHGIGFSRDDDHRVSRIPEHADAQAVGAVAEDGLPSSEISTRLSVMTPSKSKAKSRHRRRRAMISVGRGVSTD